LPRGKRLVATYEPDSTARRSRSFGEAITAKRLAREIWYLPAVQRLGYPKTTHAELLLP
jgi:hypothetical protein